MYAAGRNQELLALIDKAPCKWWHNRCWGVKALAVLRWISLGYGYEIMGADVLAAYSAVTRAANGAGVSAQRVNEKILGTVAAVKPKSLLIETVLGRHTTN